MSSAPEGGSIPEPEGMSDVPPPPPLEDGESPAAPAEGEPAAQPGAALLAVQQAAAAGDTVAQFVRNSPFLCVSFALHLAVLLLLALLTAQQTVTKAKPIALRLEELPPDEVEMMPMQKEMNLTHASGSVGIPGMDGGGSQGYEGAKGSGPQVNVPTLQILGMETAAGAGTGGDFEGHGTGDFSLAAGRGGKSAGGAIDQFAVITLNCMSQGKTLVALVIDRSASILYGDLPTVIKRMDHYFEEINMNLPHRIEDVGRWVVVSYGDTPKVECEPTCDLEQIKRALRNVQADRGGKENIGAAVEFVLNNFPTREQYKYILIAAMTDESGDDIENPVYLERVIGRLKAAKARLYVFGYESTFCARDKWVSIPVTQLKGKDLAEYQAYADASKQKIEDMRVEGFAKGGPECPQPELWWTDNWHAWQHWGGTLNNLPSGFGMYGLNRIVLSSGGIYFLLKPESNYDEEKLYSLYKPDICSAPVYRKRMEHPLKRLLAEIWTQLGYFHLGWDLRDPKTIEQMLEKSLQGRQYCMGRAQQLVAAMQGTKAEGSNWARWEAHTDVTLAELYRFRFMLGQYHEVLRREWTTKQNKQLPQGKRYLMQRGKAPDDFVGPEVARQEYETAVQYIQLAADKHKGTPWEVMAKRMKAAVYPWRCVLADVPKPSTAPPPSVHPPAIGL